MKFIVNWRNLWPESYIRIFNFSLRVLSAKEVKDINCRQVDILYQLDSEGSIANKLDTFHELNEVVDDVFSEEDFNLLEI